MKPEEQPFAARNHVGQLLSNATETLAPERNPSLLAKLDVDHSVQAVLSALRTVEVLTQEEVDDYRDQIKALIPESPSLSAMELKLSDHEKLSSARYNLTWARIWCTGVLAGGAAFVFATLIPAKVAVIADPLAALMILLGVCDLAFIYFRHKAYQDALEFPNILKKDWKVPTAALSFGLASVVFGGYLVWQPHGWGLFHSLSAYSGWWWALVGAAFFVAFLAAWQRQGTEHQMVSIDEGLATLPQPPLLVAA